MQRPAAGFRLRLIRRRIHEAATACSAQTGRPPAPAFRGRGAWGFPLSASARGKCSGALPARNRCARWRVQVIPVK